jgi:hypothetical protein
MPSRENVERTNFRKRCGFHTKHLFNTRWQFNGIFFIIIIGGAESLVLRQLWPIVQTPMIDEDDFWSNWWNENWHGKPKYSEKTYPSATLSTTKSHMTRSRAPDRSDGKPATNRLSCGAAFFSPVSSPLTTRRVTVEVFDPASIGVQFNGKSPHLLY